MNTPLSKNVICTDDRSTLHARKLSVVMGIILVINFLITLVMWTCWKKKKNETKLYKIQNLQKIYNLHDFVADK